MFKLIADKIQRPLWMQKDPRYICLDLYDLLLDGTFYNHLEYSFFDEIDPKQGGGRTIIPIMDRRPSAQFRIPRMVARRCARKLFAGRNAPKIRHKDKASEREVQKLCRTANLLHVMSEIVVRGSVGSVGVTFRVDTDVDPPGVCFQIWNAKYCVPSFDDHGVLANLRVQYLCLGSELKALGAPGVEVEKCYWYIRDFQPDIDITYIPIEKDDWNPVDGFKDKSKSLVIWEDELARFTVKHALGFVQGHWFVNLPGGHKPDGACTFEDAIPDSIDLDYSMSQVGRGVRYNAAPQLVTIGAVENSDQIVRGPMTHIQMQAGQRDEDGNTLMAGDAKLLEMTGAGVEAALKYIESLRNLALEQIAVSRKDPEKMRGPLSGKAMEYLDEDEVDLIYDLRASYGENGLLPLLRNIIRAYGLKVDTGFLSLQWPKLFQPTAMEISQLIPALAIAINPLNVQSKPGPEGSGPPPKPDEKYMLLTVEEARAWLMQAMDVPMLDEEMEEPPDIEERPPGDPALGPTPTPITPGPEDEPPPPTSEPEAPGISGPSGLNIGPRITLDV